MTRRRGWFSISLPLQQRNEVGAVSDNWVVQAMQSAFEIWNDKLTEIWSLITTTPQEFRDGDIWNAIVGINEGLKAVGYGLLVPPVWRCPRRWWTPLKTSAF